VPQTHGDRPGVLFHFSEDPAIELFVPHVPVSNPTQSPSVWAIDAERQPAYWFPRQCPRVVVWAQVGGESEFRETFDTAGLRLHGIEDRWRERLAATRLYRYELPAGTFRPWEAARGQWVSHEPVRPARVADVGDLVALHAAHDIELRYLPSIEALARLAVSDRWEFSLIRMANASA
jgi:Family of unknown function (DUF6886)